MPSRLKRLTLPALLIGLSACQTPPPHWSRVQPAWVDGRPVHYITTDVSDTAVARMMNANYAPRLRDALPPRPRPPSWRTALERVYKVTNHDQPSIFQSAPNPTGPDSRDRQYSPLWLMVEVHWLDGMTPRELRSETEVLAAEDAGEVSLLVTEIVVNCPIVGVGHLNP